MNRYAYFYYCLSFHRMHNTLGLYTACGFNIALVEYRGYGKSEGSPSEHGL